MFAAKFPGRCIRGDKILPGQAIESRQGAYAHYLSCPEGEPSAPEPEPLTPGMYVIHNDDYEPEIYKVQKSRQSENRYAKKLVIIGGRRLTEADEVRNFEFEYAPGAIKLLTAANRMTLAEAKEFGIRYGVCCVCGAFLKDATSVAAGIGPVCGGRV